MASAGPQNLAAQPQFRHGGKRTRLPAWTRLLAQLVMLAIIAPGCKKQETSVDGRTLGEWVEASRGRDAGLRLKAYQSLRSFPGDAAAKSALEAAANNAT